jgi:guanylate kinase
LSKTLKELSLVLVFDHKSFPFLKDYKKLEKLYIHGCDDLEDFSFLESDSLRNTLKYIQIGADNHLKDISFLNKYKKLKKIHVVGTLIEDFSALDNEHFKKTLNYMDISGNQCLVDISFLNSYKKLKKINLDRCKHIENYLPLSSDSLQKTVKEINLFGNENFKETGILKNYRQLEKLSLAETPIKEIYSIFNHEFVKNGSLKEISLPDSIDWTDFKNGEAVMELKKRGITVSLPDNFHYEEKIIPQPKLYVICGPPGAGKSTIINYMISELGVKQLRKVTTRNYRNQEEMLSGGIISIPDSTFLQKFKDGNIFNYRQRYNDKYGLDLVDLLNAQYSNDIFLTDSTGIESALNLRDEFPGFVEVVVLLTNPYLIEDGINERMDSINDQKLLSIEMEKLCDIEKYRREFLHFKQYINDKHWIEGSYQSNKEKIKKIIIRE